MEAQHLPRGNKEVLLGLLQDPVYGFSWTAAFCCSSHAHDTSSLALPILVFNASREDTHTENKCLILPPTLISGANVHASLGRWT